MGANCLPGDPRRQRVELEINRPDHIRFLSISDWEGVSSYTLRLAGATWNIYREA